jgi:glyoxylase-like metal-dependent hydrolase (beta-lactamase superfamily II)/8-oxo-dGTP pyrophosphatase MutT (NUDIX family)
MSTVHTHPQTHPHTTPADARRAASLLLLRDGADGLEVLMLRRAERAGDAGSGAAVFPGGLLDARDREAHAHCIGTDDATLSARLGLPEAGLDYAVAALRETFEEVDLLLVAGAVDAAALQPWRERLQQGQAGIAEFCADTGLRLDLRGLHYYSHWLTPPGAPKRFDTRFFAARMPAGQTPRADAREAQALMWLMPAAAVARQRDLKLLPVTLRTLQELAHWPGVDAALAAIAARTDFPLMMPRRAQGPKGLRAVLPDEHAYAEIGKLDPQGRADVSCELLPGRVVRLSPRVLRITAPNPGVMTGPGTNTYFVSDSQGQGWTAIDPGPESAQHLQAMLAVLASVPGPLERILVTHTHRDHSPGAAALAQATGAPVWGRVAAHPMWQDDTFAAAHQPQHGQRIGIGADTTLRVIHTPGHASNHLCFLLEEERLLFTGDHVMQGSTVVINPPDGDMAAYLAALRGLLDEDLEWLAPGHGFLVAQPHQVIANLIAHRLRREAKVVAGFAPIGGRGTLAELVPQVYDDVPPALHGIAQRSLLAHLLKLQSDGAVRDVDGVWVLSA